MPCWRATGRGKEAFTGSSCPHKAGSRRHEQDGQLAAAVRDYPATRRRRKDHPGLRGPARAQPGRVCAAYRRHPRQHQEPWEPGGVAKEVPKTEMRRGDLVEITWNPDGGGHGVFCWDVHLDDRGEVDCFQILGSNGPRPGVSIYGCSGERWLTGHNAKLKSEVKEIEVHGKKKPVTIWSYAEHGDYKKAENKHGKIFVDEPEIVASGVWLALPGVSKINAKTFRVTPGPIFYSDPKKFSVRNVRCARFHYADKPPQPYCMKDGSTPAAAN